MKTKLLLLGLITSSLFALQDGHYGCLVRKVCDTKKDVCTKIPLEKADSLGFNVTNDGFKVKFIDKTMRYLSTIKGMDVYSDNKDYTVYIPGHNVKDKEVFRTVITRKSDNTMIIFACAKR